eukprot:SAG31_NODE_1114_length_9852_cov_2.761509_7_plen_823_part_00
MMRSLLLMALHLPLIKSVSIPLHQLRVKMSGASATDGADQEVYYAVVQVGTPSKKFRVKIDTSSYDLVIPIGTAADRTGAPRCLTCHHKDNPAYNPEASSTARSVSCHSAECASYTADSAVMLPSICVIKSKDGEDVCPRQARSGTGQCVLNSDVRTGPTALIACQDHLNPSCHQVIHEYNYACNQDMSVFGMEMAGHQLSEFCPESCGICEQREQEGYMRYCADNPSFINSLGYSCSDVASSPILQASCFNDNTYVACPVACGACGDCCASYGTETGLCFFESKYGDGSEVTGVKYSDIISLSGSSPIHPGEPWSVRSTFGMITYERGNFEPDPLIDGVWGLGKVANDANCNPSCGSMQPLDAFVDTPGAHGLSDLFAICLNFNGKSTLDIGEIQQSKYTGEMYYFSITDDYEYEINTPTSLSLCRTFYDCTTAALPTEQFRRYTTVIDVGSEGLELPQPLFDAWAAAFNNALSTFSGLSVATLIDQRCVGPMPPDTTLNALGLPAIQFEVLDDLGQKRKLLLNPADYLIVIDNSVCINVMNREYQENSANFIVFGRPVLQAYYTVFDRANSRIGLAVSSGECEYGPSVCGQDEFTCQNGECVPLSTVGDGSTDCTDESDELAAVQQPPSKPGFHPNTGSSSLKQSCPGLEGPAHGRVQVAGYTATYFCNSGYQIEGLQTRQCLPSGVWTGMAPSCRFSAPESGGAGSSAVCVDVPDEYTRTCSTYLGYGYTCDQMATIYPEIDCHCACGTAQASCDSQAILDGCRDPTVALDPAHFCDNACASRIISQWDMCANDPIVHPLMNQYAAVRNYCLSLEGGGH